LGQIDVFALIRYDNDNPSIDLLSKTSIRKELISYVQVENLNFYPGAAILLRQGDLIQFESVCMTPFICNDNHSLFYNIDMNTGDENVNVLALRFTGDDYKFKYNVVTLDELIHLFNEYQDNKLMNRDIMGVNNVKIDGKNKIGMRISGADFNLVIGPVEYKVNDTTKEAMDILDISNILNYKRNLIKEITLSLSSDIDFDINTDLPTKMEELLNLYDNQDIKDFEAALSDIETTDNLINEDYDGILTQERMEQNIKDFNAEYNEISSEGYDESD